MYKYRFVSDQKNRKKTEYTVKAKVWLYPGMAGWHFVTVPVGISKMIKRRFGSSARGWGSLPVMIELEKSQWKTSIFPDKKAGAYVLPLKAEIRERENVHEGNMLSIRLRMA